MVDSPLVKKLRMRPGQRVAIVNAPPGYMEELGQLPDGVELAEKPAGGCDFVHLFVKNVAELARLAPEALAALKYDGVLWVSYPKRSSKVETDISRDRGWDVLSEAGLRPVSQVSVDATWSALRFRPTKEVGR